MPGNEREGVNEGKGRQGKRSGYVGGAELHGMRWDWTGLGLAGVGWLGRAWVRVGEVVCVEWCVSV